MRIGAAISLVVHLTFLVVALVLGEANLFHTTPAEAITVDIVSSKDVPPPPEKLDLNFPTLSEKSSDDSKDGKLPESKPADSKPQESKAETKPAESKPQPTNQPEIKPAEKKPQQTAAIAPPPAPPQPAAASPAPQPASAPPVEIAPPQALAQMPYADLTQKYTKLIGEGDGEFDALAANAANISVDSAKALREHLKTCSVLPKSISPNDNVKVVLRVALLKNGNLAKEPLLVSASASEKGPALLKSATSALLACQPYSVLPADKYDEWKVLDLSFTPKDFRPG
ncbi:MAG: cell envelope biogenesis protein TolA [Afipia sp.]|nr:cell envelope biogenesis protein TolA [Afipia sp.]